MRTIRLLSLYLLALSTLLDYAQADNATNSASLQAVTLVVRRIDMRKVLVGTSKDSTIGAMIQNNSPVPVRIDSLVFIGNDAANFSVVGESYPIIIPAQINRNLTVRFRPVSVGLKDAPLRVYIDGSFFAGAVAGEGINPELMALHPVIDFGSVTIGQWKDTTAIVMVKNVGRSPVFVTRHWFGPDDSLSFTAQAGGAPFALKPGETAPMSLRFKPRTTGPIRGSLLFEHSGVGSPLVIQLLGSGVGNNIEITSDTAAVGQHRTLELRLLDDLPTVPTPMNFHAHITSPVANYFPNGVDSTQINGESIAFDVHGRWDGTTKTLASFDVEAVLASVQSTPIVLESFQWIDTAGFVLPYETTPHNGSFSLVQLCQAGGTRLVNASGTITMARIQPFPVDKDVAELVLQTSEDTPTEVDLIDMKGLPVHSFVNQQLVPGLHQLSLDFRSIPNGSYILRMRTSTEILFQHLLLLR